MKSPMLKFSKYCTSAPKTGFLSFSQINNPSPKHKSQMAGKDEAKDAWEEMAESYQGMWDVTIPPTNKMIEFLDSKWPLSSATAILDTGCGPGTVMQSLLEQRGSTLPPSTRLYAADSSSAWIKCLQKSCKDKISKGDDIWERLETGVLDAQHLHGIDDGTFSHATAGMVMFMVPDPRKALRETRRVLTDENGGGVFALSSWKQSQWMDMMSLVSKVKPEEKPMIMPAAWTSVEGVTAELEACGFRDVRATPVETTLAFEDHKGFVDFLLDKLPNMRKITEDMSQQDIEKLRQLMLDHMKAIHPEAPGHLHGTTIVAVGRK